jgi:hypothetical protein
MESGTCDDAILSSVFARLWQRLYVHKITVIFIYFLHDSKVVTYENCPGLDEETRHSG